MSFLVSVVHVSGHRATNISRLICRFWSSCHGYYVFDLSFPIDESGMSIQVVMSIMAHVTSRMFQSYHGCHASVVLFLIVASRKSVVHAQSFPVVNYGKSVPINASRMTRVFHFMSCRRITCVTRRWCSFRSARHMSFTGVVLKMSRVSHIISGYRITDVPDVSYPVVVNNCVVVFSPNKSCIEILKTFLVVSCHSLLLAGHCRVKHFVNSIQPS